MLFKCKQCNKYALTEQCLTCKANTSPAHPPKYSKEDKYAIYRRREKFSL